MISVSNNIFETVNRSVIKLIVIVIHNRRLTRKIGISRLQKRALKAARQLTAHGSRASGIWRSEKPVRANKKSEFTAVGC